MSCPEMAQARTMAFPDQGCDLCVLCFGRVACPISGIISAAQLNLCHSQCVPKLEVILGSRSLVKPACTARVAPVSCNRNQDKPVLCPRGSSYVEHKSPWPLSKLRQTTPQYHVIHDANASVSNVDFVGKDLDLEAGGALGALGMELFSQNPERTSAAW